MSFLRKHLTLFGLALSAALAAAAGFLVSGALGQGQQPQVTTTVNVATGPQGPPGPPGPAGAVECPDGFQFGVLVINHPGGQTAVATCIKKP